MLRNGRLRLPVMPRSLTSAKGVMTQSRITTLKCIAMDTLMSRFLFKYPSQALTHRLVHDFYQLSKLSAKLDWSSDKVCVASIEVPKLLMSEAVRLLQDGYTSTARALKASAKSVLVPSLVTRSEICQCPQAQQRSLCDQTQYTPATPTTSLRLRMKIHLLLHTASPQWYRCRLVDESVDFSSLGNNENKLTLFLTESGVIDAEESLNQEDVFACYK
eukprot:6406231-Amphidinium_carterae.1